MVGGAQEDIDVAQLLVKDGVAYRSICYHSQQAAEKALKASGRYPDPNPPPTAEEAMTMLALVQDVVRVVTEQFHL